MGKWRKGENVLGIILNSKCRFSRKSYGKGKAEEREKRKNGKEKFEIIYFASSTLQCCLCVENRFSLPALLWCVDSSWNGRKNVCRGKPRKSKIVLRSSTIHTPVSESRAEFSAVSCEKKKRGESSKRNIKCLAYLAQCNLYCFSLAFCFLFYPHHHHHRLGVRLLNALPNFVVRAEMKTMTLNYNSPTTTNESRRLTPGFAFSLFCVPVSNLLHYIT
jgi:hypothetical protein